MRFMKIALAVAAIGATMLTMFMIRSKKADDKREQSF